MAASNLRKPIVLLCVGCFNPVTNKHLRIMELARDALHRTGRYRVVEGVYSPAHDKYPKEGLISAKHRSAMLNLAVISNTWLRVDEWELEQAEWTPTAIALGKLREQIEKKYSLGQQQTITDNNHSPAAKRKRTTGVRDQVATSTSVESSNQIPELRLLCGADLLESFSVPGLWSEDHMEMIVRDYGLVVISREGSNPERFIYQNDMLTKYSSKILIVTDWIGDDLSSTKVRRALRRNESIKYLVQDSVLDYIVKHKLYNPEYNLGSLHDNVSIPIDESCTSLGYFSEDVSPCAVTTAAELGQAYRSRRPMSLAVNLSLDENLLLSEGDEELAFSSSDSCFSTDSRVVRHLSSHNTFEDCDPPEMGSSAIKAGTETRESTGRYPKLRRQPSVSEATRPCCSIEHVDIFSADIYHNEEEDVRIEKSRIPSTLATPHKQKLITSVKHYIPKVNRKHRPYRVSEIVDEQPDLGTTYFGQMSTDSEFSSHAPDSQHCGKRRLNSILQSIESDWGSTDHKESNQPQVNERLEADALLSEEIKASFKRMREFGLPGVLRSVSSSSSSSHMLCTKPRESKEAYLRSVSLSSDSGSRTHKKRNVLSRLFHSFSKFQISRQESNENSPQPQTEPNAEGIELALV